MQFNMSFYMTYLARWPDYFHVAEAPENRMMGYSELLVLSNIIPLLILIPIDSNFKVKLTVSLSMMVLSWLCLLVNAMGQNLLFMLVFACICFIALK